MNTQKNPKNPYPPKISWNPKKTEKKKKKNKNP